MESAASQRRTAAAPRVWPSEMTRAGLAYLVLALLLRGATLGYPMIHIDEQFYLLVGDRMLHGQLPYIDIWDRKPIGLFLLYGAIRLLGGEGIVQYQLVALAFTVATSLAIFRMARMIAPSSGAFWAGVGYQLYLSAYFCFGGQAPVFYNLLVALSALGMVNILGSASARRLVWGGLGLMLVLGLAIQIKYTVIFEGAAFGMALMAHGRAMGWSRLKVFCTGVLWAFTALLPGLVALAYYAAIGHGADYVQANFLSIFDRHEDFLGSLWRLTKEMLALIPVWIALFWAPGRFPPVTGNNPLAIGFLRYWGLAAFLGFLVFGTWYDHYVAPLLVPLLVLAAPALGRARPYLWPTVLLAVIGTLAAAIVTTYNVNHHGTRAQLDHLADLIRAERGDGCAYINEGDPVLYLKSGACFTTRFVFPNHLNGMVDAKALGVNVDDEIARIMSTHPQVVVMSVYPSSLPVNWPARYAIFQALRRDYKVVAYTSVGWRDFLVYRYKGVQPAIAQIH
ncbi:MAG TPA: glycosyltransferase family 39 protein [Novosphingobium sp.]|nr:glycosyltransferase family 39 protein [Novosphingobium sp.]